MELHAVHVIHPMGERHHGTLSVAGRHFETIGNPIPVHYPRMIPSDRYPVGQTAENTGTGKELHRRTDAVPNLWRIPERRAENLRDGMMTETHPSMGRTGAHRSIKESSFPASEGVPGPGDTIIRSYAAGSVSPSRSFFTTCTFPAEPHSSRSMCTRLKVNES